MVFYLCPGYDLVLATTVFMTFLTGIVENIILRLEVLRLFPPMDAGWRFQSSENQITKPACGGEVNKLHSICFPLSKAL